MMEKIIFALPGNEKLTENLSRLTGYITGSLVIRHFPDNESYVRVVSDVSGKEAILICTLHKPDDKLLPLFFLCRALKTSGAKKITLVAPYLAYMRQDKKFKPGEAVTSEYFAQFVSSFVDELITIDPHLHRRHSMSEIYSIPCRVLHSSKLISDHIRTKIKNPVLIGPDSESEQWVSEIAQRISAPFVIFKKKRLGDETVHITLPQFEKYKNKTPVLVDDIISTAKTMIETIKHLKAIGMTSPLSIGVHGVFAGHAYKDLKDAGSLEVITCNTVIHESNRINIAGIIAESI